MNCSAAVSAEAPGALGEMYESGDFMQQVPENSHGFHEKEYFIISHAEVSEEGAVPTPSLLCLQTAWQETVKYSCDSMMPLVTGLPGLASLPRRPYCPHRAEAAATSSITFLSITRLPHAWQRSRGVLLLGPRIPTAGCSPEFMSRAGFVFSPESITGKHIDSQSMVLGPAASAGHSPEKQILSPRVRKPE